MALEKQFSDWRKWGDRRRPTMPGVYVIAKSSDSLEGKAFSWSDKIIYIGMTNSRSGLRGRLSQFERTASGNASTHGGAERVRHRHPDFSVLAKELFVAVSSVDCKVMSNLPADLRLMGDVAKLEWDCLAEFANLWDNRLPEFNDKKRSSKSKTVAT